MLCLLIINIVLLFIILNKVEKLLDSRVIKVKIKDDKVELEE